MADRVDETGAAYAGSQRQTQLYVNQQTAELDAAIKAEFPELAEVTIEWRSPLPADNYSEYWDRAFLEHVDQGEHAAALKAFWPTGGPHWDALAVTHHGDGKTGVLLVEGKSYPKELYSGGCAAKPESTSRQLIEDSLGWTQARIGVTTKTAEDWCGSLYQSANRLAFLYMLRSVGVRAWLVHVLFTGDPIGPTTAEQWEMAMTAADVELGIDGLEVDGAAHVILPAAIPAPGPPGAGTSGEAH
jgi:hypothetical protein